MKKFVCIIVILSLIIGVVVIKNYETDNEKYLRFHVRANSNSSFDQYVKYEVKDKVVSMLSTTLSGRESYDDAYNFLKNATLVIQEYANFILKENNCDYKARVAIKKEYFDERVENDFALSAGVYDTLLITLGEGNGNNWWCLVYPSLSFIPTNNIVDYNNIIYKSKLVELYNKTIN